MSALDNFLPRLERVAEVGAGRWIASCPTSLHKYGDRSKGLAICEKDDGIILIKCFAGCGAADIVQSVGLELKDLFPAKTENFTQLKPHERWIPRHVISCLSHETLIVAIAASDIAAGKELSLKGNERLLTASERIVAAAVEVGAL